MVVSLCAREKGVLTLAQRNTTNVALLHSFEDSDVALFTSDLAWRGMSMKWEVDMQALPCVPIIIGRCEGRWERWTSGHGGGGKEEADGGLPQACGKH